MSQGRPVPWVPSALYAAVLVAGGYAHLVGLGTGRPVLFVTALVALFVLDVAEWRRWPGRTPPVPAGGLLAARAALFLAVAAGDGSGLSRALFVLIPFTAYFAFGRLTSVLLGLGCVALVVVVLQATAPRWYADVGHVSDLLMFAIGVTLTIVMAGVAVGERAARAELEESHAGLRAYADRVAELSAEAERNRVTRDIHDGLGHHLTATALLLEKAAAFGERDPETASRALAEAQVCVRGALEDVRRSVRTLRAQGQPSCLSTDLAELIRATGGGGPRVSLEFGGEEAGLSEPVRLALYRAAQEAVTNARRHSGARHVTIAVALDARAAQLTVTDDGCGFINGREGFGLTGMRERVTLLSGQIEVRTAPGNGTRLTVTIPRHPVSSEVRP